MLKIILIVSFIILIIIIIIWFLSKPVLSKVKYEDILKYIKILLEYGKAGNFVVVNHKKTKYYIQFGKYVNDQNDEGIYLDFPEVNWSSQFYKELKNYLDFTNELYETVQDEWKTLRIDFKKNLKKIQNIINIIILDIFKLNDNTTFNLEIYIENEMENNNLPPLDNAEKLGMRIGILFGTVLRLFK